MSVLNRYQEILRYLPAQAMAAAPGGPSSWTLHCIFFFFLIATATGLTRSLLHVAYLRPSILVPPLTGDVFVVLLARVAAFSVDRTKTELPNSSVTSHDSA